MPRYFFDTTHAGQTTRDDVGIDLPGLEAARSRVAAVLPDLMRRGSPDGEAHTSACDVREESGNVVYRGELTYRGTRNPLPEPTPSGR